MGTPRAQGAERRNIDVLIPRIPQLHHINDFSFDHIIRERLKADKELATWSTKPRLYIFLRMLQRDPSFATATFNLGRWAQANDLWLPLPQAILGRLVSNLNLDLGSDRLDHFKLLQECVLSSPFELSEAHLRTRVPPHRHVECGDVFFDEKTEIDYGASARVYRVRYKGTGNVSACKEYPRGTFMEQRANLELFATELVILRRLKHPHVVKLVASFTDESFFAIIMDPAADTSLRTWFEGVSTPIAQDEYDILQRSFGCLMSALTYLHAENVRHKDIKPSNILLKGGTIYLCDFGISYDWTGTNPTTNNRSSPRTEGYCAPEVMDKESKSSPSDVWSMGRVFCDIITIKHGRSLEDMLRHIGGDMSCIYEEGGIEKMMRWLLTISDNTHQQLLDWTSRMMRKNSQSRPEAHEIFDEMCNASTDSSFHVAPCCWIPPSVVTALDPATQEQPSLTGVSSSDLPFENVDRADTNLPPCVPKETKKPADEQVPDRQHSPISERISSSWSSLESHYGTNEPGASIAPSSQTSQPESSRPCNCNPQTSVSKRQERHLLTVAFIDINLGKGSVSAAQWSVCSSMGNCIQIYESYLETDQNPSDVWLRTRRLVISIDLEKSGYQRCSDIWLPLADLYFTQTETDLTMQWSDCTRWTMRTTGNYDFDCDRAYIPENPNRKITIHFQDIISAQRFVEVLRILYVDADPQNQKRQSIGSQQLHISDMRHGAHVRYRVASLTSYEGSSVSSKLFIHKPVVDFNISTQLDPVTSITQTTVDFDRVRSPHYVSSVVRKPNKDSTEVGRCAGVKLKMSAYKVHLPPGPAIATSAISMDVKLLLSKLTGWDICFFALNVDLVCERGRLRTNEHYGRANLFLWKTLDVTPDSRSFEAKITFRQLRDGDTLWRSGAILTTAHQRCSNPSQVKITVHYQLQGNRLDTSSMSAVQVDGSNPTEQRPMSEQSSLLLTFESAADSRQFNHVFLDLLGSVEEEVLALSPVTTAITQISREPRRSTFLRSLTGRSG